MPSFDLAKKTLKYAASDCTAIDKAVALLTAMADVPSGSPSQATADEIADQEREAAASGKLFNDRPEYR